MRLALDVSPLVGTRAGVGTYVEQLVRALIAISPEHQYYLYTPHPLPDADVAALDKFSNAKLVRCPAWLMGSRARWDRVDIFHGMNYKLRGWGRYGGVVTIHDLALDRIPQPSRKLFGQQSSFRRGRRTALRASRVIAVSQHTASDIAELYGVPRHRIAVVSNGAGADFYPIGDKFVIDSVKARCGIVREQFILATGGAEPRKNIVRVLEAFGRVPGLRDGFHLVVVGGVDRGSGLLHKTVHQTKLQSAVLFPGHVPTEDLRALYSSCSAFVFPSLYEGFGMPVLEAMACGAPVICSNTSALPEVAGDAAILVDPTSVEAIANAIAKVLSSADVREELHRRGPIRAKSFGWDRSARELLAVYADLATEAESRLVHT
ncbi:MAG TPA: glycosyltransferase family 1 protein [Nitrospirales bacterium]|jgi:glycosyltransferase involved in cell wall biosynthesis